MTDEERPFGAIIPILGNEGPTTELRGGGVVAILLKSGICCCCCCDEGNWFKAELMDGSKSCGRPIDAKYCGEVVAPKLVAVDEGNETPPSRLWLLYKLFPIDALLPISGEE